MLVRRLVLAVLGSALVTVGIGGVVTAPVFAAGDANRAACPAATEAATGFRTFLPDCRAYELATPPYKEGAVVFTSGPAAVAADGSELIVGAGGAFAGAENFWWDGNRNSTIDAYLLRRTPTKWETSVITPPASTYPHSSLLTAAGDELGRTLWGLATTTQLFHEDLYMRRGDGTFSLIGPGVGPDVHNEPLESTTELAFAGASRDLRHQVFSIAAFSESLRAAAHGHSDLWPGDTTRAAAPSLYEYDYTGTPSAEPRLVGVKNKGRLVSNADAEVISECGTMLGAPSRADAYNAVSQTGDTTFFTALHQTATSECAEPSVDELYARVDGESTVAISEPSHADCEVCDTSPANRRSAHFAGAAADGSVVVFTTTQALVTGQEGTNLYVFKLNDSGASSPTGKIALISGAVANPEVQGVVRVSQDGSHVYFVAKAVLTGVNGEGTAPVAGADNLYVYEPDPENPSKSHVVFVATLLTPESEERLHNEEVEEQAKVEEKAEKAALAAEELALSRGESFVDALRIGFEVANAARSELVGTLGPTGTVATDTAVWQAENTRPVQLTDDGRFLVFLSSEPLTPGNESTVPQLFEYDAGHETLTRVSAGVAGSGNVKTFGQAPQLPRQTFNPADDITGASSHRAVTEDGARVFFTSAARLVGSEAAGSQNVYEYENGQLHIISDGSDSSRAEGSPTVTLFGVDGSGSNVFFLTATALVPEAAKNQVGLYDARVDGGYLPTGVAPSCQGDGCRGPSAAAPQLPSASSAVATPGDNAPPGTPESKSPGKQLTRHQKLLRAMKVCKRKPARLRAQCRKQAMRRFGPVHKSTNRRTFAKGPAR
jgi:hypothetical protein